MIDDQRRMGRALGARPIAVLSTVATSWLLVVCSLVAWSLIPIAWGWQPTVVITGSMAPRLAPGDVVLLEPPRPDRPVRRGQVVLVTDPMAATGRVIHRVVRVDADGMLTTQGDANPSSDPARHSPDEVRGVARLVVPAAGRVALLRTAPAGDLTRADRIWLLLTAGAAVLFALTRLR